jgi:hypothetical protein
MQFLLGEREEKEKEVLVEQKRGRSGRGGRR